ncbi:hypothetical protein G9A89_021130 [Geosiphon pyriformis]|nr:hypothetical protein G9A89_021130 [Geosiphon pyriformis]
MAFEIDSIQLTVVMFSVVISLATSTVLIRYMWKRFTYLRLACVFAGITIILLSTCNLLKTLFPNTIYEKWYWFCYELLSGTYTSLITIFLLFTGRRFYAPQSRHNNLFKFTCFFLLATIIVHGTIAFFVLPPLIQSSSTLSEKFEIKKEPNLNSYIVQVIVRMLVSVFGFLYAFMPVLRLQFRSMKKEYGNATKPDNNNMNKLNNNEGSTYDRKELNPQNAAVGIWYMTTITLLVVLYISFYASVFILGMKNSVEGSTKAPFLPVNNAIDFILRIGVLLVYGIPPSGVVLKFLIKKIKGSNKLNTSDDFNISIHVIKNFDEDNTTINEDVESSRESQKGWLDL